MSTKQETADYILSQLSDIPAVRVRKMFGEYALYVGTKVVALICDDQLFIKDTDPGRTFAKGMFVEGHPYPGAKPAMNVTDMLDDQAFLTKLVQITETALPIQKKK